MTGLLLLLVTSQPPTAQLMAGYEAFRAGDYAEAARRLQGLAARSPRTRDYVSYLDAESAFYTGAYDRARSGYGEVAKIKTSRFAGVAAWRGADCLWAQGKRAEAAAAYRKLLAKIPPLVDPVVARFRLAELASGDDSARQFRKIFLESPAHPLADEAAKRAGAQPKDNTPVAGDARERLRRAEKLADGRHYDEALRELDALAVDTPELRAARDFQIGMAKYRMRRDYPQAAALLLGAVPQLPGDKAAFAQFHGARALSRADRDDEAIAGYRVVVERFGQSRWAAEAQFLSGWLEFNRGRWKEAAPGLEVTLARHGRTAFAADAAWFLALARYFGGAGAGALDALDLHEKLARKDPEAPRRALYWRGRILETLGRTDEGRGRLRDCARRWPFDYYGLLARARLKAAGETVPLSLPSSDHSERPPAPRRNDPTLERADELLRAGLIAEAGYELERAEEGVSKRLGREAALPLLLERYARMQGFRRAYHLAEGRAASVLQAMPSGSARLYWEAAYPQAYKDLIDKYGPPAGNPDLFLYAIMRKESGFAPQVVSYADARGLLQVIPAVGEEVAADEKIPFFADELFDPDVNVRLGAAHIGGLVKRFGGQLYLVAGAYNGGSKPMQRWVKAHGRRPFDEFVELVTYEQTREYMKRVVGIYARYLYLYRGEIYQLPMTLPPLPEGDL